MILAIDIGNTNVKVGLFREDALGVTWRMATNSSRTADEYGTALLDILATRGYTARDVKAVAISSVIPGLNYTFDHLCDFYFNIKPLFIGPGTKTGLNVKYDNPKELGSDRIATAVAAIKLVGCPCIVVDLGTAISINAIGENNEFLGGAICPGIKTSGEMLVTSTAKLPKIELVKPERVVGRSTVANMQSGLYFGFIGMIENLIAKIKEETGLHNAKVVATGGQYEFIKDGIKGVDRYDRTLSLCGIHEIYKLNRK